MVTSTITFHKIHGFDALNKHHMNVLNLLIMYPRNTQLFISIKLCVVVYDRALFLQLINNLNQFNP